MNIILISILRATVVVVVLLILIIIIIAGVVIPGVVVIVAFVVVVVAAAVLGRMHGTYISLLPLNQYNDASRNYRLTITDLIIHLWVRFPAALIPNKLNMSDITTILITAVAVDI
jgi:O-antigen ligase